MARAAAGPQPGLEDMPFEMIFWQTGYKAVSNMRLVSKHVK